MECRNESAPGTAATARDAKKEREEALNPQPATKWRRVLSALAEGRRLHRFQAERQLHDHCLHSTISAISQKTGLRIERRMIEVAGYMGLPVRVSQYWLSPDERRRARAILRSGPEGA